MGSVGAMGGPLPSYGEKGNKRGRRGQPFWKDPRKLKYLLGGLVGLVLLLVLMSSRQSLASLKEKKGQLESALHKHTTKVKTHETQINRHQREMRAISLENTALQDKLSEALEKLQDLEVFFERHQEKHAEHADEKELWEKEKKYLHEEIEKIRDSFLEDEGEDRDSRGGSSSSAEKNKNESDPAKEKAEEEKPEESKAQWMENKIKETNAENKVVIYSKSYCQYSKKAKEIFDKLGVEYVALELNEFEEGAEVQEALAAMTGIRTVPQVFVNGDLIGGSDDTQEALQSGRLKKMLAK